MNANERRRYDMLIRVRQFGDDNAADFPAGTIGATQFAAVTAAVGDIESMGATQQAGFAEAGQQYEVKSTMRENLREHMSDISRTARSMEYAFNGIQDKFRLPRNRNDADLLNTGRAFATEAAPYNADFQAYGLPPRSSPTSPTPPTPSRHRSAKPPPPPPNTSPPQPKPPNQSAREWSPSASSKA